MKPARSNRHTLPQAALLKQHISLAKKQIQLYQSCCQKLGMAYPDYTVLNMLSYHPKGSRPTDIASALAIQPQTLTRILAAMRELGYIDRQTQENDHRSAVITITEAGAATIKPLQTALQAIEEKALASFSIDEMTKLSEISSRLLEELSAEFKKN
ncbi:MAG: MarR family transcriptional regulator [Deferribacteraceae bacterium]|nr:MarR family transcriptional regulator [Deferribacteraceae bacterium]